MAAKTVEEIKDEIVTLIKSQGNQGAISLGTVLDDIAELAGEGGGGGGGSTPNVISVFSADGENWTIDNPDDLAGFAAKAEQGELVMVKSNEPSASSITPITYSVMFGQKMFIHQTISVRQEGVSVILIMINVEHKTITTQTQSYPSN